jgi:hypothetical protein
LLQADHLELQLPSPNLAWIYRYKINK